MPLSPSTNTLTILIVISRYKPTYFPRWIKEISEPKAPRGIHVTPPQPIVKNCPHIIEAVTEKLSALLERNITFALNKAMALQVFRACIKKGMVS